LKWKFHQTKDKKLTRVEHFSGKLSGLADYVQDQAQAYNTFFGAAARDGHGGEKGNVTAIFALWGWDQW